MHFHADHPLFFERRQPTWHTAASLAVTIAILATNAGAGSASVSLGGAACGMGLLLAAHLRGHRRLEPALAWTVLLVALALGGGVFLARDPSLVLGTVARISCGVVWVLWLGTRVDWASLRELLLACRVPTGVVGALDHAVLHGVLTQREWVRRREAARLRLGGARLPLASWGSLLGEGALHAFVRLERVEENGLLRSSASAVADAGEGVCLDAVDVERGGQRVLEQIDLSLGPTEWMLVCGPSGAGKSSLLRLLAGLDQPSSGTMTRFGVCTSRGTSLDARLDGRVALLSQNPEHHFIASSVAEDIVWGLLRRGVDPVEAQRRCTELATALRIDHLLDRPCHELSFGEQRRVALAGILVVEPALLLLDEPTAGLDPVAADELRALVERAVRRTGSACIWASHDLNALPTDAERVVLLRDGRLVFDGPREDGLSRPRLLQAGLAVLGAEESTC